MDEVLPQCPNSLAYPRAMALYVLSLGKGFCLWHSSITAICRRTCAGVTTSGVPSVSVA